MKKPLKRVLFWMPRVLIILFAVFISLFALDVFSENRGSWETILALLIHLIPVGVILIMLAISWRWELVGGILFVGLGALYLVRFGGQSEWSASLAMSGPPFLAGVLFLFNWLYRTELRASS